MRVGIIGAGAISGIYIQNMIEKFPNLEVVSIAAAHLEHAREKAARFGLKATTVEAMLADPSIDMIVNLTPVGAHYDLIHRALMAGKHVYTEKTITDDPKKARELLKLADRQGLYLGAAPDTFLGSSLQTARMAIDYGKIGEVTSVVAAGNRDNNVLLSLFSFLSQPGAGIVKDYGVYYITALVSLLGPISATSAYIRAPFPEHVNINPNSPKYGRTMDTPNESEVSAILKFRSGITGIFQVNADSVGQDQAHICIYGTKGMLYLSDPNGFGGDIYLLPNTPSLSDTPDFPAVLKTLTPVNQYSGNERGIGPAEMAKAIEEGRQNRANKEMAYHVLEVLDAMLESHGNQVKIQSVCKRPEPFLSL